MIRNHKSSAKLGFIPPVSKLKDSAEPTANTVAPPQTPIKARHSLSKQTAKRSRENDLSSDSEYDEPDEEVSPFKGKGRAEKRRKMTEEISDVEEDEEEIKMREKAAKMKLRVKVETEHKEYILMKASEEQKKVEVEEKGKGKEVEAAAEPPKSLNPSLKRYTLLFNSAKENSGLKSKSFFSD